MRNRGQQAIEAVAHLPASGHASRNWQRFSAAGVAWRILDAHADVLLDNGSLRLAQWLHDGRAEVVKSGPHRTVYRLDLPQGTYYLKHFRVPDWKARLRNLVRPTPAEREFLAVQRLAALRFPTFEPCALGVTRRFGMAADSYLVSRAVEHALPLDHYLLTEFGLSGRAERSGLRQRLARELGRLAARLHAAGVEHIDLHAGNLLIRVDAVEGAPLLALIDLHSVRFLPKLDTARRDRNLAALHQFFAGRSTRADRRRFFDAYRQMLAEMGGRNAPSDDAADIRRVEQVLTAGAQAGWIRADRAWARGNRHVRIIETATVRCRGLASLDRAWLSMLCDEHDRLTATYALEFYKQAPGCVAARLALPGVAAEPAGDVFCKLTRGRRRWRRWMRLWSPARRAWELGHALLRRGIDTPRPLACLEDRGPAGASTLVTEHLAQTTSLAAYLRAGWLSRPERERRRWLRPRLRRLAAQLQKLHGAGFDHRDLKSSNLLVARDTDDARVWLLDLDHVRRWIGMPRRRRVQNLARLEVSTRCSGGMSNTDRLRFLRWYLEAGEQKAWKAWWRQIARRADRKVAQNFRRQRPLS